MSDNELLLALRNEIQPIKDTLQETRNELDRKSTRLNSSH